MAKSNKQQRVEEFLMRRLLCGLIVFLCSSFPAFAQTGNATLSGRVTDQSKALVVGARVVVTNVDTNVSRETKTNGDGYYTVGSLPPGPYKVEIDKTGFENIVKPDLILHTQDVLEINFELRIGSSSQTITVTDSANPIDTSPAVSMTVTREFVENMPLNGRSFQDLIQLAPGAVSSTNGYYSIDGQRTDANNFMVDGVSANLGGVLNSAGHDGGASGSTPSQTAMGTTQSLASIDALQEFKIQTSGYTAEYGRNPGGHVSFSTRSGTNDIHGCRAPR
jgi:Carboxypeptidase regulatory-like domain/TonB-dependent Receptor Plug Domain